MSQTRDPYISKAEREHERIASRFHNAHYTLSLAAEHINNLADSIRNGSAIFTFPLNEALTNLLDAHAERRKAEAIARADTENGFHPANVGAAAQKALLDLAEARGEKYDEETLRQIISDYPFLQSILTPKGSRLDPYSFTEKQPIVTKSAHSAGDPVSVKNVPVAPVPPVEAVHLLEAAYRVPGESHQRPRMLVDLMRESAKRVRTSLEESVGFATQRSALLAFRQTLGREIEYVCDMVNYIADPARPDWPAFRRCVREILQTAALDDSPVTPHDLDVNTADHILNAVHEHLHVNDDVVDALEAVITQSSINA